VRICYLLLSPTWGMHQYTADLANRRCAAGDDVHVVTTSLAPRDRYAPGVGFHAPAALAGTGFSAQGVLRLPILRRVEREILAERPDVVHFTGPHLWNPVLIERLHARGVRVVHTLHDLHPHLGAVYGHLLYLWNGRVERLSDHLLVHGRCYRDELIRRSLPASRVTCTLLTHLFLSHAAQEALQSAPLPIEFEPWALCIGRLERYKGLGVLAEAARRTGRRVCIAGPGPVRNAMKAVPEPWPGNLDLRNRLVGDSEAIDLFRRCGVVVLPYLEASQSALVAAAHFFRKPVIVSRVGALPEYVEEGVTGWIVPAGDAGALATALDVLSNPARLARLGAAGRAWWERRRREEDRVLAEMYSAVCGAAPI